MYKALAIVGVVIVCLFITGMPDVAIQTFVIGLFLGIFGSALWEMVDEPIKDPDDRPKSKTPKK